MIPTLNITAWSAVAPWSEPRQVEQDLIISRAIVALFSDPLLKQELRFRGGTALNKLHFPAPLRELCGILGDGMNQAADFASNATSIPSRNVTPLMTFGN